MILLFLLEGDASSSGSGCTGILLWHSQGFQYIFYSVILGKYEVLLSIVSVFFIFKLTS